MNRSRSISASTVAGLRTALLSVAIVFGAYIFFLGLVTFASMMWAVPA